MLVTTGNRHPINERHESPVAPRFSFANPGLMRIDDIAETPHGRVRQLAYPTPPDEALAVRQAMVALGLVMGDPIDDGASSRIDRFAIDTSYRPISYDTATNVQESHTYNDELLFFDLGKLLGALAGAGEQLPLVLHDLVGENVATKGFTRPGEPKILFVPGFELSVHPVENDDAALNLYMYSLHQEFDQRFEPHVDQFIEGFRMTLG